MIGARRIALRTSIAAVVAALVGTTMVQACGVPGFGSNDSAHERRKGTGTVAVVAAPVGQTRTGKSGVTPGVATFKPARPGRVVLIQGKVGSRWKTVSKAVQDKHGQVTFSVTNPSMSYRALAPATKKDAQVVTSASRSANWGKPTWRDEFAGSGKLNPAIWSILTVPKEDKFACVVVLPGNAYRQKGVGVLKVSRLPGARGAKTKACPYGQFGNSIVMADGPEHRLTYGIAAARVKFAPLRGLHSAFWLDIPLGQTMTPGVPADGVEIDVAEYFGDKRPKGGLASFVHGMDSKGNIKSVGGEFRSRQLLPKKKEWSQGWHVYSVEWSPSGYVFRVDGITTMKTKKNLSHSPEKVLLSAITSDWEQPALDVGKLPTVTKYDWVRVWQRPS